MKFSDKISSRILYSHVLAGEAGMTLLDYLASRFPRFDRDGWRNAVENGAVLLNNERVSPDHLLKRHDCAAYYPPEMPEPEVDLAYKTLYADDDIAVFEKPAGLCVHPTGPFYRHTLWALATPELGELHFISRLDRETSGLVCAARNKTAAAGMCAPGFRMRKEYLALVIGRFETPCRMTGFLTPDPAGITGRKKRFVNSAVPPEPGAEFADTELEPVKFIEPDMTLVRARLHTGKRHQIRITLCSMGFPVVGDKLYGPDERLYYKIKTQDFTADDWKSLRMNRQALHASLLAFDHPVSGKPMTFTSNCPFSL